MGRSPRCYIPSFVKIGPPVLEKKILFLKGFYHIWAWRPSWSCDLDHLYKLSFPLPKEAPHKIWLWSAKRFLRRRCLKNVDGRRRTPTDDGPWVYYKLTFWAWRLRWANNKKNQTSTPNFTPKSAPKSTPKSTPIFTPLHSKTPLQDSNPLSILCLYEPRYEKNLSLGFPTRSDTNRAVDWSFGVYPIKFGRLIVWSACRDILFLDTINLSFWEKQWRRIRMASNRQRETLVSVRLTEIN